MPRKVILLVISLSILLTGSAMAQFDHGLPDTLALEVTLPPTGTTNGQLIAELWCFNDADDLLGVSIGLQWSSGILKLDSVVSDQPNWDMTFLEYSNNNQNMLFAGLSINANNTLPMGDTRKKLATWYCTLVRWDEGDQIAFDTSEYFGGAAMLMSNATGDSYKPVWAGGDSWITFVAPAIPRSWYLSPNGNDNNDGSLASPFASFHEAYSVCNNGDTILALPGTYTGDLNRGEYVSYKSITIMSTDGAESTILDAENLDQILKVASIPVPGIIIDGLTFRNGNHSSGGAMEFRSTSGTVKNCIFENNIGTTGGAVYLTTSANGPVRFENCVFRNNKANEYDSGIFGMAGGKGGAIGVPHLISNGGTIFGDLVFDNCRFTDNTADKQGGVFYSWESSANFFINNCTFVNNSCDTGAVIWAANDPTEDTHWNISKSILAFNQGGRAIELGSSNHALGCTDIYGNPGGDWIGGNLGLLGYVNNNFSEDPLFCDPDNQDYHINALSPCAPDYSLCGELVGALNVGCEGPGGDDEVYPTNEWISIYCPGGIIVEGEPLGPDQYIKAYDPDGVLCGLGQTNEMGQLPLFSIYRDDIYSERDEGAEPGDMITFVIDGQEAQAVPSLYWTANGAVVAVCEFKLERCLSIRLNEGWNLISWNVVYEAEITEALADIMGCVDVVLGFEQGGLTFDPDLPQFSSLSMVDFHHGYWVRMNCAATLSICGPPIEGDVTPFGIAVEAGWNLLSYWPTEVLPTEIAFAHALQQDALEVAIGFDHGAQVWLPGQENFNSLTELKAGFGYWARMRAGFDFYWTAAPFGDSVSIDFNNGGIELLNSPSINSASEIKKANSWVSVYGADITLDDEALKDGALFTFHTASGELRGEGLYQDGRLAFTSVYGPDQDDNPLVMAPVTPEQLVIKVDGESVDQKLKWTTNGDRIRLERLISSDEGLLPTAYSLGQNYPNPFNPSTTIEYALPEMAHVEIDIFNLLGQRVVRLVQGEQPAGSYQIVWDGRSDNGQAITSGVYFYKITAGTFTASKKMLLVK